MVVGQEQVRVLVVSGSAYVRYVISGELSSEPDLFVVGTAQAPDEIDYKQALLRPDLVVVDLESMRDLSNLRRTLAAAKSPVLVLSSQAKEGAELAFAALEAGATDIVARSNGGGKDVVFAPDLLRKVRGLARARPRSGAWKWASLRPRAKTSPRHFLSGDRLVVICASTGGLGPLVQLLTGLPEDLQASLLVLSPLPSCYVPWFLRRLDPGTTFHLAQARDGLPVEIGVAYFAPCDYPLTVGLRGFLTLDRDEDCGEVRSATDMTLSSLAARYGPAALAVILSGIGHGGVQGALDVCAAGGSVVVQDTTTCLAEETPGAIIEAGAATVVSPPELIAAEIVRLVSVPS